jgi:ABC-type Mn2+/Zn2+ transport system permease subunit
MSWLDTALHRAVIEAILVGAGTAVVGVQVVLRRLAFFTMAMTHATFPGVVIAAIVGLDIYIGGAAAGLLAAVTVVALARRPGQDTSAATGIALAAGFALGVALLATQDGFTKELSAFLTGSILTVTLTDLAVAASVLLGLLLVLAAIGKELVYVAFDRDGAQAAGYRVSVLDLAVLLLIEAVVVTAVPAVGAILALALIVAPAGAARLWTDRIGPMTLLAVGLGVSSALGGLWLSALFDIAAGGAISLLAATTFGVSVLATSVRQRWTTFRREQAYPL